MSNAEVQDLDIDLVETEEAETAEVSAEEVADAEKFDYKEVVEVTEDFVIPANFDEFNDRYPRYIRTWLVRHRCPNDLLDDFEQDMRVYILQVSANAHKKGIHDRIMSYNFDARIGANSAGKFFFYVNLLLVRKWTVLLKRRGKRDILSQRNILIIDPVETGENYTPGATTVEELYNKHNCTSLVEAHFEDAAQKRHFIKNFLNFIKRNEPDLLDTVKLLMTHNTMPEVCKHGGIALDKLNRDRNRLRILAEVYERGLKKIPTKRRAYTKRGNKEASVA